MSTEPETGPFDADVLMASLEQFPARLRALVEPLDDDTLHWRSPAAHWSVHEIVCHLLDEERRDFRPRLERTLRDPSEPWDPIDPEGWVRAPGYAGWDRPDTRRQLLQARAASVAWLRGLAAPDWSCAQVHPKLGSMHAGDLLLSWAQHDLLHIRQVVKRLHERSTAAGTPCEGRYAGSW